MAPSWLGIVLRCVWLAFMPAYVALAAASWLTATSLTPLVGAVVVVPLFAVTWAFLRTNGPVGWPAPAVVAAYLALGAWLGFAPLLPAAVWTALLVAAVLFPLGLAMAMRRALDE